MNLSEAIDRIRPSIVQITFFASSFSDEVRRRLGRPFVKAPLGTGFFVHRDGYVVTANHVIELGNRLSRQMEAQEKRMQIGMALTNSGNMRGNFSMIDFDLAVSDARHDIALLRLRNNPFRGEVHSGIVIGDREVPLAFGLPDLDSGRPKEGASVGISGYPLSESVLVTNSGHIASVWSYDVAEMPVPGAPEWFRMPDIADTYLVDSEVNPGNSGGPVYLVESAEIIGICVATKPAPVRDEQGNPVSINETKLYYSSGLTVVIQSRYVIRLIEQQTQEPSPQTV